MELNLNRELVYLIIIVLLLIHLAVLLSTHQRTIIPLEGGTSLIDTIINYDPAITHPAAIRLNA